MKVTKKLKVEVEVIVEIDHDGHVVGVLQPDFNALFGAAKARYSVTQLRQLFTELAKSRVAEDLVRIVRSDDRIEHHKLVRVAKGHIALAHPRTKHETKYSRHDGREIHSGPWSSARIHEDDLRALNERYEGA